MTRAKRKMVIQIQREVEVGCIFWLIFASLFVADLNLALWFFMMIPIIVLVVAGDVKKVSSE